MGKGIHRLTDREVQAAKPRPCMIKGSPNFGKPIDTVYSDGAGLYLKVTAAGTKSWVYRYMIYGKSKVMGLGPVHTVSLSKAREHARQHRETKYDGLDPIEERDRQATIARVGAARAVPTFADAAEEYIAAKEAGWRDTNEGPTWRAMFSTHAALLMPLPVDQIDTPLVLRVIKPIWTKRYKLARKLQSRIEAVLAAATVSGYRQGDNPAQWKGYIDKAGLSAPASAVAVQPRKAIPYANVPALISQLQGIDHRAARAIEFLILTAARAGEAVSSQRNVGAKWSEIDFESRTWTIPANRMKGGVTHRVPLSDRAMAILREAEAVRAGDRVFGISYWGVKERFDKLCPDVDLHGCRSSFRDWCSINRVDNDIAEKSIAHYTGSRTEKAYNRDDLLALRRPVMERWARFCCGQAAG